MALNDTTVMVIWAEPLEPNGILDYYDITYQLQSLSLLQDTVTVRVESDVFEVVLTDLHEFAGYNVTVRAINGMREGETITVAVMTLSAS